MLYVPVINLSTFTNCCVLGLRYRLFRLWPWWIREHDQFSFRMIMFQKSWRELICCGLNCRWFRFLAGTVSLRDVRSCI
jgi:hypothetical protein